MQNLDKHTLETIHQWLCQPGINPAHIKKRIAETIAVLPIQNNMVAQHAASCVKALANIKMHPDVFVAGALKIEKDYEAMLDLLYKTQEVLELAILSTPTGHIRNSLCDKNIKIANMLNPQLVIKK